MSRWRVRSSGIVTAIAVGLLGGCGGGAPQDTGEPSGNFPVAVAGATFPATQRIAQSTHMVITVRNSGNKTIPNVAVTIRNPSSGPAAQPFGFLLTSPGSTAGLASRSRAIWIVDQGPGTCSTICQGQGGGGGGGAGGAETAYASTWALGVLKPGGKATFDWRLTAIRSGTYQIQYLVAAGLNGKAKAVLSDGSRAAGTFKVTIHAAPAQSYVNNQGKLIVTSP